MANTLHTLRLPHAPSERLDFHWNGATVEARVGDTVAAALYAAGRRYLGPSRKFHEPRGLSGSFVGGHLGVVDGVPHVRLDRTPVRDAMDVRMQNIWPNARFDILHLARLLPRRFLRAGFEHPRFIPDWSPLWRPWERSLAFLAGQAQPPSHDHGGIVEGRRIRARTVIIGGGPAGRNAAVKATRPVVLISHGAPVGARAGSAGKELPALPDDITVLAGHTAYALYDGGSVVAAAPFDDAAPAILIDTETVVVATGARSVPPIVPGITIPGVLDAHTALDLSHRFGVSPGQRVLVTGTAGGEWVAERLRSLGVNVVEFTNVSGLSRIVGRRGVEAVEAPRRIPCDSVVHAGPWRADPALPTQSSWSGELRLEDGKTPDNVQIVGAAAAPPEVVSVGAGLSRDALVCPCMDVTVSEVLDLVSGGTTHVEEIKHRTGCGMGPCQGSPCWDLLAAVLADATGRPAESFGHPTYRAPRAALTFGQAAGLVDRTEVAR